MKSIIVLGFLLISILSADTKVVENKIEFTIQHKFKTVKGKVQKITVSDLVVTKQGEGYSAKPFSASISVLDLRTGNPNRDSHMLEILGYPLEDSIQLNITKVEEASSKKEYKIYLDIKINGTTKSQQSIANVTEIDGKIQIKGQLKILLDEYKIKAPSLFFIPINNTIVCEYEFLIN
jgi:hypothetical protein